MPRQRFLLAVLALLAISTAAQQSQPATVAFSCDFPGSDPAHYGISVASDGHSSYISDGKLTRDSDPSEPITVDFMMPQPTLTRIFDLTKKAHYFEGEIDSKKKNLASTGEKTLTYKDEHKNTTATYNYSL